MSWHLGHMIGPPQAAAGTSSSEIPISNSDIVQVNNNNNYTNRNDLESSRDQYGDVILSKKDQPATQIIASSAAAPQPSTSSTTTTTSAPSRQHRDQDYICKLLNEGYNHNNNNNMDSFDNSNQRQEQLQQQFNQQTSKTISTTASISSAILTPSSSSLIDQLLPQTDQTSLPWSTTYSMPVYSPLGLEVGAYRNDGENSIIGGVGLEGGGSLAFQNALNFDANKYLSLGGAGVGLVSRFSNQANKSDNTSEFFSVNPSTGLVASNANQVRPPAGYQSQQPRQSDIFGAGRSYSSVLHAQTGRSSISDVNQHQMNRNDPLAMLQNQSSLIPTNVRQSPISLSSSPSGSAPSHYRQARHANDYHSDGAQLPPPPSYHLTTSAGPQLYHQTRGPTSLVGGQNSRNTSSDKTHLGAMNEGANTNSGPKRRNKLPFFTGTSDEQNQLKMNLYGTNLINSDGSERFSRKVFVGGLPPDIDEEEIKASFRRFGSLVVDWPHKAESKSYFPPKGYAFLLFHEESSVQALIDACLQEDDKLYLCVSSPTIKDKPVQIRPWRLSDADYVLDATLTLDPRKTVFVGGVPRPLKASELANIMNNLYGGVCYAGIDTDPELKYPKGAGRVAFSNHQSYIAAISARFVHLHHSEIEKRVEVKPYVLDDQHCDECQGARCANKFAPFFCANITCLRYYCDNCWSSVHSKSGREFHKPLVKEGSDRPRGVPFRWGS